MQIANPIYDVVFKYLMQNNEIAILILSTILEEEILSLDLLPQETAVALENRTFTVYKLDFSALIKTASGEERHVVIEIQKAKFAADIMRFRRYLGEQYKKGLPIEGNKAPKAAPIISIYFLGYKLEHVTAPVIKVLRSYLDTATGEEIRAREEFIETLTHDSFVIQIPQLGPERRTSTEKLLAIFDQHRKVRGDSHILDIDEEAYPEEYRKVVRWLNGAVSESKIRQTMEVEDDILAELEDMERQIASMGKTIEEKGKALEEKNKALEEKNKALEEKDKALEEKDRLIAELRKSQ
uniref:PD-(D/E)XK nuclease family transposase n=1 Tax=Candidatus Kentrum eta TaxID=2126337 RepID=A0A450UMJ0_9GAMM|nr:MAG: PD-(D/E)XK nuclease family transposase [Candidatus Kentron sp. H]VFJ93752.1 MAG: PD-(D/E)XK nuclease family transposase [Candidatus Kentron sp. H]VFK00590.1 MAG: PD-(D/E)XK nuclease family transposase [Candidatus Kentron sp. H]